MEKQGSHLPQGTTQLKQKIISIMKTYNFKINGKEFNVSVNGIEAGIADVTVNGASYKVELGESAPIAAPAPAAAPVAAPAPAKAAAAPAPVAAASAPAPDAGGYKVTSPLPGVILDVNVNVGDKVAAGQKVAVLEAMKMENEIQTEKGGTVTAILAKKGDSVLEGATIITIG